MSESPGVQWVYFIEHRCDSCGFDAVKIGHAADVRARLSAMQVGSPSNLTLLTAIPTPFHKRDESSLHRKFSGERIRGEWFKSTSEIRSLVGELAANLGDLQSVVIAGTRPGGLWPIVPLDLFRSEVKSI